MRVSYSDQNFICTCKYEERHLPREAGFRWSAVNREWFTPHHGVAARLREYADQNAKREINRVLLSVTPWSAPLLSMPTLTPYPFQITATKWALSRNRCYLALDPGLGKTAVAAMIMNNLYQHTFVYICPPFLVKDVEAKFKQWEVDAHHMIIGDSMLLKKHALEVMFEHMKERNQPTYLFVDEAHRFKTESAKRTKALFDEIVPHFDRIAYMSGTPLANRPMELYPVLSRSAPEVINYMSRFDYGRYYCAGFHNGSGWDFSGASHMNELSAQLKSKFMLRIRKSDVLKELPPKLEEIVVIGDKLPAKLAKMDSKLLATYSPEDLMRDTIGEEHISAYRRELGAYKVEESAKFIDFILDESEENLLVFAIHTETIARLSQALAEYRPLVITGKTPVEARQRIVDEFQTNKNHRLFIGNVQAAGTGFTLTKATRVIFVEYPWVPAEIDQASDRAHRIGQTGDVLVQFLVYQNSIDRTVLDAIFRKRKVIAHV